MYNIKIPNFWRTPVLATASAMLFGFSFLSVPAALAGSETSMHQYAVSQMEGSNGVHMGMTEPAADADEFEKQMYHDMTKMMVDMHAPGYTGNRDIDFLAMMIPHHQGAIDMARLLLIDGIDPLTRSLAEGIIAAQQSEINAMQGRLVLLRTLDTEAVTEFPALSGTRGVGTQN